MRSVSHSSAYQWKEFSLTSHVGVGKSNSLVRPWVRMAHYYAKALLFRLDKNAVYENGIDRETCRRGGLVGALRQLHDLPAQQFSASPQGPTATEHESHALETTLIGERC